MTLERLKTLLCNRFGWDQESIPDRELNTALQKRAVALGIDFSRQPEHVVSVICHDPQQLLLLSESLAVHETWFFRGIAQMQDAVNHLSKSYHHADHSFNNTPIRFLSAPCSTGEEAYSLAILLSQHGFHSRNVRVDGVDLSSAAVAQARIAAYTQNAFRELGWSLPSLVPGIQRCEDRWCVNQEIRGLVRFEVANLLDNTPPPYQYDYIFCRNLLIYLSHQRRRELLQRLASWLTPQGRLYVSPVEATIAQEADLVALEPYDLQVFGTMKKNAPIAASNVKPKSFLPAKAGLNDVRNRERQSASFVSSTTKPASGASAQRVVVRPESSGLSSRPLGQSAAAIDNTTTIASPNGAATNSVTDNILLEAEQAADAGQLDKAELILAKLKDTNHMSAAIHFLKGVVAQARGNLDEAQYAWEQAVYLDPQHGPALQRLWLAASARGDLRLAEQYRRRWLKRRVDP
jgi:chemotaxis protein methyltransferase WspC